MNSIIALLLILIATTWCSLVCSAIPGRYGLKRSAIIKSRDDEHNRVSRKVLELRGGEVMEIKTVSDFDNLVKSSKGKLIVIDFSASWCGPCKMIAPAYEELSSEYTESVFCKVDVDDVSDIAQRYEVMAMPTFLFIKNGDVVGRFSGASIEKLRNTIISHL